MIQAILVICAVIAIAVVVARSRSEERITMPAEAQNGASAASVESMILAGRKIEAIKILRQETGLGLKDAKDEVERRARRLTLE